MSLVRPHKGHGRSEKGQSLYPSGKIETGLTDPIGLPGNGQEVIFEDTIEHPSPTVGVAACFVNDQNEGS